MLTFYTFCKLWNGFVYKSVTEIFFKKNLHTFPNFVQEQKYSNIMLFGARAILILLFDPHQPNTFSKLLNTFLNHKKFAKCVIRFKKSVKRFKKSIKRFLKCLKRFPKSIKKIYKMYKKVEQISGKQFSKCVGSRKLKFPKHTRWTFQNIL